MLLFYIKLVWLKFLIFFTPRSHYSIIQLNIWSRPGRKQGQTWLANTVMRVCFKCKHFPKEKSQYACVWQRSVTQSTRLVLANTRMSQLEKAHSFNPIAFQFCFSITLSCVKLDLSECLKNTNTKNTYVHLPDCDMTNSGPKQCLL